MSPEFESLVALFNLIQKRYEEAQTHDERVHLAIIAKETAREARKKNNPVQAEVVGCLRHFRSGRARSRVEAYTWNLGRFMNLADLFHRD